MADKIVSLNQGTIGTQIINIQESQKVQLIYSDPVPDLRVFQGREDECSELNTWLTDSSISMIGIRGEGGIGKSTLMAKVFAESVGFTGKSWADVRTGTSIAALAERSLQEFGALPEQVRSLQEENLIPRLLRQLQQGRYLLAIDNLESVLTASGDWQGGYEEFLDSFQNLESESVLLLAGREYPQKYHGWRQSCWLTLEQGLTPSEGAALLESLEVIDTIENRATLSEQVQGNPLALSLIAGWLRDEYRQPEERRVSHLSQHTDLFQLEGKHRGEPNISVDRVLQWSVDRLTSAQRYLLAQVSVLRGAFDAELATALVLEPPVSDADLHDLERRSLLQELPKPNQDAPRVFQLQPRIREFVQKQRNDLTPAHKRAIDYFWNRRRTITVTDPAYGQPKNSLELPVQNALGNSHQTIIASSATQADVAEYIETFYHQLQLRQFNHAFNNIYACTEILRLRGYYQTIVEIYSHLYFGWEPSSEENHNYIEVCRTLGNAYRCLGQYQKALNHIQKTLQITQGTDNNLHRGACLTDLGNIYQATGKYQQAIDCHQKALEIIRQLSDQKNEAAAFNNLGLAHKSLGRFREAVDFHQQSLEASRRSGNLQVEAESLIGLGLAYCSLGEHQQALQAYQQSLEINRKTGNRRGASKCLGNLGTIYDALGQYHKAIDRHRQHYKLAHEIGDQQGESDALCGLGNAHSALERYHQAIDLYNQSLEISHTIGDRAGEAASFYNLGSIYHSLSQY